ncbi:hypothetical protein [Anaeromonas gelatinilytica]|nr:hypothetical protein [Anaeromonas gelatinilytica]
MTNKEKAQFILDELAENVFNVDWNSEEFYIREITKILQKLDRR